MNLACYPLAAVIGCCLKYALSRRGLYYGEVSLATSIPIFGRVSLDPRIAYSTALGSDGKDAISAVSADGKKDVFYGSVAVTAAF